MHCYCSYHISYNFDCLDLNATMPQAIVNGRKRRQFSRCSTTSRKRRSTGSRSLDTTKRDMAGTAAQTRLQNEMNIIQRYIPVFLLLAIVCLIRIRRLRSLEQDQDQDNQESIARLHRLATITLLAAALFQQKYLALRQQLVRLPRSPTILSSRERFLDDPMLPCRLDFAC